MELFAAVGRYGFDGRLDAPHKLITHQFMHFGKWHLIFNMIFLWTFGATLESLVGRARFIAYYLTTGALAALFHGLMMHWFSPRYAYIPLIGASGAISGIMGVYLVRGYFSKVKVAVSLFGPFYFIPYRFKLSPLLVIGFYFILDFRAGVKTLGDFSYIAYWAHVGGILSGLMISFFSRHLFSAHLDKHRQRSRKRLDENLGLAQARQDLEAILRLQPDDLEAMLELARLETRYRLSERGDQLYRKVIVERWKRGQREQSARAFAEYIKKFQAGFKGAFQLSLARELIKIGEYDAAARALQKLIHEAGPAPDKQAEPVIAQAYITLGRLIGDRLHCPGPAVEVFKEFLKRFPFSENRETVLQKIKLLEPTEV